MPLGKFAYSLGLVLSLLLLAACGKSPPTTGSARVTPRPNASDKLFAGEVLHLEITIRPKDVEKINRENRPYVPGTLVEKNAAGVKLAEYKEVAFKLKGAAGSFQGFDGKPALTVRPDKTIKGQLFHDLARFHLNNSVQDETYLHEQLCSELMAQASVPATRVTHARVRLNGRDVGLYVLKEGFDHRFLARHFARADGNLYDGGFCTDIDADLEKDSGGGPDDLGDLRTLREACSIEDPPARWKRLEELVDVDSLLSFVAMELMTCHWDGYAKNRNNYRLYFEPTAKRAYFFPHGMDQMFGDPGFSIVDMPEALVVRNVLENPVWREQFQERVGKLLPLFSPPDKLLARVDVLHARLRPIIAAIDPNLANEHAERVRELKERIVARAQSLEEQKSFPAPRPLEFDEQGVLHLTDWRPAAEVEDAGLEVIDLPEEKHALQIACGPSRRCIASWRRNVLLPQGNYQFIARLKTTDVQPITDDRGIGAGLRISGAARENQLAATTEWTELTFEFAVEEEARDVELVAELRALGGTVQFELESLRLVRK